MTNSTKRQKKGYITEEGMSDLLQRYPPQKVLAMLQEVSHSAESSSKMDWHALVQKTATGITSAREYQMLWRHIAYGAELLDKVDESEEPLDDDSDLEFEMKAYPPVSAEASAEAAACVKVLLGSGDSKVPNSATVEAPLTLNIPTNGQSSKSSLEKSINITVPVSVQKQPVPQGVLQKQIVPTGVKVEGSDANGLTSTSNPNRRKRKPWSEEEDLELIAAVRKCGEGNWANILKGDFKGDRTASQLSQRWTIIRKRKSTVSIGAKSTGPKVSDAQLAANRAIDLALKPAVGNGAAATTNAAKSNPSNNDNAVVDNNPSQPQQSLSTPPGGNPISSKPGTSLSLPNPRAPPKKAPLKPLLNTDSSMVTKLAVAAGARIASPLTAATLYKAAQANNAIHIMPKGVSSLIKSSVTSTTTSSPPPPTHVGPIRTVPLGTQTVRPNLARPTTTTAGPISHVTGSQPVRCFPRPTVLPPPSKPSISSALPSSSSAPLSHASLRATTVAGSTASQPNEVKLKKEEKVMKAPPPPSHPITRPVPTQNIGARPNPLPASSNAGFVASSQAAVSEKKSQSAVKTEKEKVAIGNDSVSAVVNAAEKNSVGDLKNKNESLAEGRCEDDLSDKRDRTASEMQNLPSSKVVVGATSEVRSETAAVAEKSEEKKVQ